MSMIINPYRFAAGAAPSDDPYWANVSALLHFDGSNGSTVITDVTGRAWTASGNAQLSTSSPMFGTASLLLDGTGDYVSTPNHADFAFGTGAFTVECQARPAATITSAGLVTQWNSSGNQAWAFYVSGGNLLFRFWDAAAYQDTSATWTHTPGQRYSLAVTRDASGVVRVFVDGVVIASGSHPQLIATSTNGVRVGGVEGFSLDFNGAIDEVRITKGVARYTANYTPQTAPFPDTGSAALLNWSLPDTSASFAIENANLDLFNRNASGTYSAVGRTLKPKSTGKWYFEVQVLQQGTLVGEDIGFGVESTSLALTHYVGQLAKSVGYWLTGTRYKNSTTVTTGAASYAYAPGDILGIAFDADTGNMWFRKNGTWIGTDPTGAADSTVTAGAPYAVTCTPYRPAWGCRIRNTLTYALPAGFARWT